MINKYREITLFEIENGWVLRITPVDNPANSTQAEVESTYCKDDEDLLKVLEEKLNVGRRKKI